MSNVLRLSCFLLIVAIVQGDILDTYLELSKDAFTTCAKDLNLNGETLRAIYDKNVGQDESNCLIACTWKSLNLMKDSKINQDKMMEFVKKAHADQSEKISVLQKSLSECVEKAKDVSDECKLAHSIANCFVGKINGL